MNEKYSFSNPPPLFFKALGKNSVSCERLRKEASKQKIKGRSKMKRCELLKALKSVFIEQQIEQDNIRINIFKNLVEGEKSHISYIIKIMEFVPSVSGFRALATTSRGAFQLAYSRFNIKDKEYLKHLRLTEKAYLRYRVMSATFEQLNAEVDRKGSISVLDMGVSVKIDTLAKQMIKMAGFTPDKESKIQYTGLKKGEKLHEKLFAIEEKKVDKFHKGFFIVTNDIFNAKLIYKMVERLEVLCKFFALL